MTHLTVISCGGTIDKIHRRGTGTGSLTIGQPAVREIIHKYVSFNPITFQSVARMNSLDMTDQDRARIVRACVAANSSKIIITHGLETIVETAQAIHQSRTQIGERRAIVLTGAALPYCMKGSDAEFQIGLALGACMNLDHGVYIAVNGIHRWDRCRINPKTGMFEFFMPT